MLEFKEKRGKSMIKIYDENKLGREVVRISVEKEEDFQSNVGKTASFIIKALVFEKKEVFVKFISSTKKLPEISLKTQKMLIILHRMISEGLESKFGLEVPEEFKNKKMMILTSLPYVKDTELFKIEKQENGEITKTVTEFDNDFKPKATIIKLYLAEQMKE